MAQLRTTRNYTANEALLEQDLDAFLDDIETFFNTTKLDDENIQDASITGSTKLVDASVTIGKVAANAATTAKIENDAVTAAKLNSDVAGTALTLSEDGIDVDCDETDVTAAAGTIDIIDDSLALSKFAALTKAISSSDSGSFSTSSTSFTAITNLTVNITTTGRQVVLMLIGPSTPAANGVKFTPIASATNLFGTIAFYRDSTRLCELGIGCNSSSRTHAIRLPAQSFLHTETPIAGTYTYTAYAAVSNASTSVDITNCRLMALEI